jgi:nitrogen regulatory protein PII
MEKKYELIIVIVNEGFSGSVVDAARDAGAGGGTVVNGRGTAKEEMLSKFQIFMSPEKELVLILATKDVKENILKSINKEAGSTTEAHGIIFTLPVDEVVGLKNNPNPIKEITKEEIK